MITKVKCYPPPPPPPTPPPPPPPPPPHVHSQLHFVGEDKSPGVKTEDGVINHVIVEVELECLPKNIPQFIEVDLSEMHVGDIVHLSDLKLPSGVEILALKQGEEHDTAVASMHVRKVVEEVDEGAPETPDAPESETGSDGDSDSE